MTIENHLEIVRSTVIKYQPRLAMIRSSAQTEMRT